MKFFVAFTALVAVAIASPVNKPLFSEEAQLEAIIAAIQSPNTDPATAILLEQQLQQIIAAASPIAVGPAIVEAPIKPPGIVINPIPNEPPMIVQPIAPPGVIIIPTPVIDDPNPVAVHPTPVIVSPTPVDPSPVMIVPGPVAAPETSSAPLVQIILNINQELAPVVADVPIAPTPVIVVDETPAGDTPIILPTPVFPGVVPEIVLPTPVLPEIVPEPVVLPTPVLPEIVPEIVMPTPVLPGIVPEPVVLPAPVINLPEILN